MKGKFEMNAKDIAGRKFEKSFSGYKPEEVDDFIKEISADFSALQKENRDLEKKLEVLADKIREYRNDEDVLKEALLGAQRQGNLAISEAKEKAASIVSEAKENAEKLINEAEDESKKIKEKNRQLIEEAEEKQRKIISDANEKADKINNDLRIQVEMQKEILSRIKNEVNEYLQKLVIGYKKHIEVIEAFPGQCENEYLNKINNDYQKEKNIIVKKPVLFQEANENKREQENIKIKEPAQDKVTEKNHEPENMFLNSNEEDDEAKKPIAFEINLEETSEIEFQPIFDDSNYNDDNSDNDKGNNFDGSQNEEDKYTDSDGHRIFKRAESNINNFDNKDGENLFFKKANHTYLKNEKRLDFGNNAKTVKKK